MTASGSSWSAAGPAETVTVPAPLPPLPAAWVEGRDRDLLLPLRLARPGDALPPPPLVDRREVATGLGRANRSYGHPLAGELAARLADPSTRVVVGGQQPGLFGGPLMLLLKMMAAGRWAEELARRGEPAVALFWVGTEDHDWEEASWASVWTAEGVHRVDLGADPHPLVPLGMRTLGPSVEGALATLAELFPYEPYASWLAAVARWYRPDARFGEAFCKLAVALLGKRCPLLVDAQLPELKVAERPLMLRLVERRHEVGEALARAEAKISGRGYPLQVQPQPDTAPLFALAGGERRRVTWTEEGWRLRGAGPASGAGEVRSIEELLALIEGNPAAVSPNVLSRPPLQDAVLGTSIQVMGPAELAYLAQAAPLYELLGISAPVVVPRPRALVLEPRQLQSLAEAGLDPRLLLATPPEVERALASRLDADPAGPALERALSELASLREVAVALDPNLERPWEKTQEQVKTAFERFAEKLTRARAQRDQVAQRRLSSVREYCQPGGELHERVLAAAHFRGRYGEGLADALWSQLELGTVDVQLLRAPEAPAAVAVAAAHRQSEAAGAEPGSGETPAAAPGTSPDGGAVP